MWDVTAATSPFVRIQPFDILSDESLEQGRNRSRELRFYSDPPYKPILARTGENPSSFLPQELHGLQGQLSRPEEAAAASSGPADTGATTSA